MESNGWFEEKNRKINELAKSLKYDKLSCGVCERKYDELYLLILDYKKMRPVFISTCSDDPGSGDGEGKSGSCAFARGEADEVMMNIINDSFLSAFGAYKALAPEKEWPFAKIFNSHLRKNNLSFYDEVNRLTQGDLGYKTTKELAEITAKEIASELGIKDFSLPDNIMQSSEKVFVPLFKKYGATDKQINRLREAIAFKSVTTDVISGDDGEEGSIYDVIPDNSSASNTMCIENESILEGIRETFVNFSGKAGKKWARYFISNRVIEGQEQFVLTEEIKPYVDEDYIKKAIEAQLKQENKFDLTGFLSEYTGRKRETVLKAMGEVQEAFAANSKLRKAALGAIPKDKAKD